MVHVRKNGVLVVNLGSPDSTKTEDVRTYLREFLMDGRVIDIPAFARWLLVDIRTIDLQHSMGNLPG